MSTRALWQPPVLSGGPVSRDISGESRRMGERNENLFYPSPWDLKRTLKVYSYHHASIVSGTVRCGPSPYGILGENHSVTGPYPEPDDSSPRLYIIFL
jgi:hypothetical protein